MKKEVRIVRIMDKEHGVVYMCNHIGCQEKSWLGNGFDWKMCEITFGIHPGLVTERGLEMKGVPVIKRQLHFCKVHTPIYKDMIYFLVANRFKHSNLSRISGEAVYKEEFGCWITFHDCISHEPIKNMQMAFEPFCDIYNAFCKAVPVDCSVLGVIQRLKKMASETNL